MGEGNNDDIVAIAKTFDGSQNVGFALTLKDIDLAAGTYGDTGGTKITNFETDSKGRVIGISTVDIQTGGFQVDKSDGNSSQCY